MKTTIAVDANARNSINSNDFYRFIYFPEQLNSTIDHRWLEGFAESQRNPVLPSGPLFSTPSIDRGQDRSPGAIREGAGELRWASSTQSSERLAEIA